MTAAEDTRARVVRLVRADPSLSAAEVGRALGVTRQLVHRILKELGWRQEWREGPVPAKRKAKGGANK